MFVALYNFFQRYKAAFWGVFALTFGLFLLLAGRIRFEEDITSMLPDSKAIHAMNDVISHTQAGEQVIFIAAFKDTTTTSRDSLITAVTDFYTGLQAAGRSWIDTINLQPGGGGMEERMVSVIRDNLPLFLNEQDFKSLDTLLQPEQIRQTLAANRKILLSPASVVYARMVAADPVGMSRLVWSKLAQLQFDPNYETYDGYIFSKDGKRLTFFLKPRAKASETGRNSRFFEVLNSYMDSWQAAHPGVHITYFGGPAVAAGNAAQLRTDTIVTLSVTILLLLALTFYYFRRKRTPLLMLVPVTYGAALGLATVYLVQGHISVIALGAGAIVLGIAIDYSMHFLSHARHADMRATIRELQQPLTIGSFTTIAAFLSLRLVHTPILRDLGLFAAAALIGAALCTLIFLPHFPVGRSEGHPATTVFDKMARWQPEKNKWLLLLILLITPVMGYFSFKVQFDDDLMHLNYLSPRMQQAQDEVSRANAFALSSVFVVANEADEETALQHLEQTAPLIDTLTRKGWVRSASDPTLLIPSRQEQQRRIRRWQAYWTPQRQAAVIAVVRSAAAETGFNAGAFSAFEASLTRPYTPLDPQTVGALKILFPGGFSADKDNHYAIAALKVPAAHRKEVFEAFRTQPGVTITDKQQGALQMVKLLNTDFNNIALYTTFIVFFALLIGYGRIELALMSFLPMAISWVWILGLMAILGLKFNIVNIIISTLIFGLGDDYSIFTLDGLMERYRLGTGKLASVRSAVYVSVTTVLIGLGVLLLAKHPALRSIAFISVTGIICVLFISQTLQPFLFNFFIQRRADKKFLPFTLWSFAKSVFAFAYFFTGSLVLTVLGFFLIRIWPFDKEKGKYWFHVWLSRYTWSLMHIMLNVRKRYLRTELADFSRPAVYIANHASFLDILLTTGLHPRLVLLTNRWVWRSPVFGAVVRMAEYYPVADGATDSLEPLADLVNRGYSIIVFPEGTRSYTDEIHRFHKGAFYIAEKLGLDIVPLLLHGVHYTMQKGDFLLKDGTTSVYYNPRIPVTDARFGRTYSERAKGFRRWFREELERVKEGEETPAYFREQLLRSYTYKGPVLEWYCRIKTASEGNYEQFHQLIPRQGLFYDLGCGYGFMTYMLHWAAPGRAFIGVDYDAEKIATAQHNFLRDEGIRFEQADITSYHLGPCDGIIISDVLHYLLPAQQEKLLEHCVAMLRPGGRLIIRDGVRELEDRFRRTRLSEFFSTRMFKFNKTSNDLHFISQAFIEAFSTTHGLRLQVADNARFTSNLTFILQKD